MSDLLANLSFGFGVAATAGNLFACLMGALIGTLVGVLPGVGPLATIAMLLPLTFGLEPTTALIMLAGIYYGAQYGGSTTAILINMPGEVSSVVTTIDGHQMAKQGRAGAALATAAIGSFVAGTVATVLIAALGKPLSDLARLFGPADYFSLMILGLICAVILASGSLPKAFIMIATGLLLATVGADLETGEDRLTFGLPQLNEGIDFVSLAMGVLGFAEILRNLEQVQQRDVVDREITSLMPTRADIRASAMPIARGTVLGSILGVLPGGGATLASFASYTLEKRLSRHPERFGHGAIEGVAGPESANNAAAQTSFIPLLSLGIPPNAVMAIMVGAMMIHGIVPGPQIITNQPQLFWGMIASMWIGNVMLLIINLPLIGLWVKLLRIPYRILFPAIMLFCCVGVYSISGSGGLMSLAVFTVFGYGLVKFGFELAPFVLAFVLGPLLEQNFRWAMLISNGDPSVFVTRPLSVGFLIFSAFFIIVAVLPTIRRRRERVFAE